MQVPYAPKLPSPAHWSRLTVDDQSEYLRLVVFFATDQRTAGSPRASNERRESVFMKEIFTVLEFVDRSSENREERSVITGICVCSPYICLNTSTLKTLLGRCKSSINGLFQDLGYKPSRGRSPREFVVLALPSLSSDTKALRQWTVRRAMEGYTCWFLGPPLALPDPETTVPEPEKERQVPVPPLELVFEFNSLLSEPPAKQE
jgi:hypothetical protein